LDSVRLVTDDEQLQEALLRASLQVASKMDFYQPPPVMGQRIYRLIEEVTGEKDLYRDIKDRLSHLGLEIYPKMMPCVERSENPLETSLRLAAAGNIIDLGLNSNLNESEICDAIQLSLKSPFEGNVEKFTNAIAKAGHILYLADNTGEIFFDRLLITQLPREKITFVVRGYPVIGDITMDEARKAGLTRLVEVIDNGSDAPGTILNQCTEDFCQRFEKAELIISKGQGNYGTLSEVAKDIFFLLKAKCPVVARDLGCPVGSLVLQRSTYGRTIEDGRNEKKTEKNVSWPVLEWKYT